MSQTTLDSFFSARKKVGGPDDQHAAKKRKVLASSSSVVCKPRLTKGTVTSASDDHGVSSTTKDAVRFGSPDAESLLSTPKSASTTATNCRTRKRDSTGAEKKGEGSPPTPPTGESALFAVGRKDVGGARRRLNLGGKSGKIPFILAGNLSPSKKGEGQRAVERAAGSLSKITPQEIKAKLGQVKKLSDLKAQLKSLQKDKNLKPKHKRALFDLEPRRRRNEVMLEVEVTREPAVSVPRSPLKASPRKDIPSFVKYSELAQPDKYLPLPSKYKFLAEIFRNVDQIVGMKFNRKEMIRVSDLRPGVQNIMRRNFEPRYMKQIRCVLPRAYDYAWEKILDRLGRPMGDYELHLMPNLRKSGLSTLDVSTLTTMTPNVKVERVKMFQHSLLSIVKDCHQDFLKNVGIDVDDGRLTKWHRDFDVESCPEIDTVDFPPKPHVERLATAREMIEKLAGVNLRLESALNLSLPKEEDEAPLPAAPAAPRLRKGLQGLPQHLIDKILAKENEKRIRDMTQGTKERKDVELMKELVLVAPVIVNCHRNQRKGAAVPIDTLCKVVADSHGRKSKPEMLELIRKFLEVVPECMEVRQYDKIEYVKRKKDAPDVNGVRAKLKDIVAKMEVPN